MKEEINFRVSVLIICILSFSSIYLVSSVAASVQYPSVWGSSGFSSLHGKSVFDFSNLSLNFSTTTSTGFPVKISINYCQGENRTRGYCFGQGEGVSLNKKNDNIDVFDLVSTSNQMRAGFDLNQNDNDYYYNVDIDFGKHEYTSTEYDEMIDVAISTFQQKLNQVMNKNPK